MLFFIVLIEVLNGTIVDRESPSLIGGSIKFKTTVPHSPLYEEEGGSGGCEF